MSLLLDAKSDVLFHTIFQKPIKRCRICDSDGNKWNMTS